MASVSKRQLVPVSLQEEQKDYPGHTTLYVVLSCVLAASGGLLFGYDIGNSGGVAAMFEFQLRFFPEILSKEALAKETDYCKYNNHWLQTFTSSLYLAGLVSTYVASWVTDKYGRKLTMLVGGVVSLAGAGFSAGAETLAMLILGRACMGWGLGFANQVVPLYTSEMAPAKWRGGLNVTFQLAITMGIFLANMVNYFVNEVHNGWRISFAVVALPAILLATGGWLLPDTPMSLIRRGLPSTAHSVLQKIRGTTEVGVEFGDLQSASQAAESVAHPFQNILERHNRPQLVIAIALQFFQQFTGINAVMFYAPVLFKTLGYGAEAALYSAVITGAVNMVASIISIFTVDRLGRRVPILAGGLQMFLFQVGIGTFLAVQLQGKEDMSLAPMSHPLTIVVVIFTCLYVAAFAWSWGPLAWLIPSEILTSDTRSAGQSIAVSVNMFFTFIVAQFFLSTLCAMKWGIFLFFGAWVVVMEVFVLLFVPETKGMHITFMDLVWKQHWYWKRFMRPITTQPVEHSLL